MTTPQKTALVRPVVVISKCLEFAACRYNGQMIGCDFVKIIRDYVDFVPVCPEVEIGLGTPREPIKLAGDRETLRLVQPATGKDLTDSMNEFGERFLGSINQVDGFILKSRSPSCGIKGVKVHSMETGEPQSLTARGLFAGAVVEQFAGAAIADEVGLGDDQMRDLWLTRLYLLARFRHAKEQGGLIFLEQFHEENRMLLLSFNFQKTRLLDKILADDDDRSDDPGSVDELSDDDRRSQYTSILTEVIQHQPRNSARSAAYTWAAGRLRDNLDWRDRSSFQTLVQQCAAGQVTRSLIEGQLLRWAEQHDDDLIRRQTLFAPYPVELSLPKQ